MDDTCEFTIYNLIFADLKKIMQYAFTIYDLQIFLPTQKKILMILRHLQFTNYKTKNNRSLH